MANGLRDDSTRTTCCITSLGTARSGQSSMTAARAGEPSHAVSRLGRTCCHFLLNIFLAGRHCNLRTSWFRPQSGGYTLCCDFRLCSLVHLWPAIRPVHPPCPEHRVHEPLKHHAPPRVQPPPRWRKHARLESVVQWRHRAMTYATNQQATDMAVDSMRTDLPEVQNSAAPTCQNQCLGPIRSALGSPPLPSSTAGPVL